MRAIAAALAVVLATPALAQQRELAFYGYAYDLKSNAYLYTEVHRQKVDGDRWLGGTIDYFLPDGTKLGHKDMDFFQDPFVPVYTLEIPVLGYMEAITSAGPELTMQRRRKAEGKLETTSMEKPSPIAGDSGFHMMVRAHFAELMAGDKVDFRLAVAGSLDTFKFRARRIDDTTFEEQPAVRFKVEPNSLLRFVADPLELTYDPKQKRLLEYRGISNVRDPANGDPYNVRIAYYSRPPAEAPKPLPELDCTLADCGVPNVE